MFLDAPDVQNAFQGALWGAIGKCTEPPGSLLEGLQVFGSYPKRAPDTSGRHFDVPKHPRSHLGRPPRITRYPKSARV